MSKKSLTVLAPRIAIFVVVAVALVMVVMAMLKQPHSTTPTSAPPDVDQTWRTAVEQVEGTSSPGYSFDNAPGSWEKYKGVFLGKDGLCTADDDVVKYFVILRISDDKAPASRVELDFKYACPDRMDAVQQGEQEAGLW